MVWKKCGGFRRLLGAFLELVCGEEGLRYIGELLR